MSCQHKRPQTQQRTIPPEHTNQDTQRRQSKGPTANRTEHKRKRNPTGKPWRARQTAKAPGPLHPMNRQAPKPEPPQSLKPYPPTGNQRGKQKLPTATGPTTKHAARCNTPMPQQTPPPPPKKKWETTPTNRNEKKTS